MHKAPAEVQRDQLAKKTKENPKDVAAGNYSNIYSLTQLQKISSENNLKDEKASDLFTSLILESECLGEKYGKNTVFILSRLPFKLAWSTPNMAQLAFKLSAPRKKICAAIDCSAKEVRKPKWDKVKDVYNYHMSVKAEGKSPVGVSEYISNDHHEFEVANWLARTKERFSEINNSEAMPFSCITIDMSWALTNAVLQEYCSMGLMQYLEACINAKRDNHVWFIFVAWCYAHFQKAICRKVGTLQPVAKYKYSPARALVKFSTATLARSSDLSEAGEVFRHFVIIVKSKDMTAAVREALEGLANKFGYKPPQEEEEGNEKCEDDPDVEVDSLPVEDRVYTKKLTTYKDSPFYKFFYNVAEAAERVITNASEVLPPGNNLYYMPKIVQYLLRYMLPTFPLWSRFNQCQVFPDQTNPLTNFSAELHILQAKQRQKYKSVKATKYMRDMIEDAEKRILAYDHDLNFKRSRYARKRMGTPSLEEVVIERKRPQMEVWARKNRNVRPPGGFYSQTATQQYASKLIKRARKSVTCQKSPHGTDVNGTEGIIQQAQSSVKEDDEKSILTAELNQYVANDSIPIDGSTLETGSELSDVHMIWYHTANDLYMTTLPNSTSIYANKNDLLSAPGSHLYMVSDENVEPFFVIIQSSAPSNETMVNNQDVSGNESMVNSSIILPPLSANNAFPAPSVNSDNEAAQTISCASIGNGGEPLLANNAVSSPSTQGIPDASPTCEATESCLEKKLISENEESGSTVGLELTAEEQQNFPHPDFPKPEIRFMCSGKRLSNLDFESLYPGSELSDEVLNALIFLAAEEMKRLSSCSVYVFETSLLENVSLGMADVYCKMARDQKLVQNDILMAPSHLRDLNHWIMFIVLTRTKRIILLDSLKITTQQIKKKSVEKQTTEQLQILMLLICESSKHSFGEDIDWGQWSFFVPTSLPSQMPGSNDCGVVVCLWAFVICGMLEPPRRLDEITTRGLRSFMANLLKRNSSTAQKFKKDMPPKIDWLQRQYNEINIKVKNGSLVISKPWKDFKPRLLFGQPDRRPWLQFLQEILPKGKRRGELWKATKTVCGAETGCLFEKKNTAPNMYQCERGREWLHVKCLKDSDKTPVGRQNFFCSRHANARTTTRVVERPLKYSKE